MAELKFLCIIQKKKKRAFPSRWGIPCCTFTSEKTHLFIVKSHWYILDFIWFNFSERSYKNQVNFKTAFTPVLVSACCAQPLNLLCWEAAVRAVRKQACFWLPLVLPGDKGIGIRPNGASQLQKDRVTWSLLETLPFIFWSEPLWQGRNLKASRPHWKMLFYACDG